MSIIDILNQHCSNYRAPYPHFICKKSTLTYLYVKLKVLLIFFTYNLRTWILPSLQEIITADIFNLTVAPVILLRISNVSQLLRKNAH